MKKNFWKTIVLAGLLVGCLDIIAALVNFYSKTGKDPLIVLKYIASAVFGKSAFSDDNTMAIWGLLLHFLIAFIWTIIFFLIYPKLKLLSWNRIVTGILYGIFIWIMMSRVVVPISKASVGPFDLKQAIIAVLILIAAIGLPLSFMAHRYYAVNQSHQPSSSSEIIMGYIFSFLPLLLLPIIFMPIAIVLGLTLLFQKKAEHGVLIIIFAIATGCIGAYIGGWGLGLP